MYVEWEVQSNMCASEEGGESISEPWNKYVQHFSVGDV